MQIEKKEDNIEDLNSKLKENELIISSLKKQNLKITEDYENLNEFVIPNLKKQIDEKDLIIQNCLIEQIKLTKELNSIKENSTLNYNKYTIPEFEEEKDNLIMFQQNKIECLNNLYKQLKNEFNSFKEENEKKLIEKENKIKIQKDEILLLTSNKNKNEEKLNDLNAEINSLTNINKNLILEIKTLNDIIKNLYEEKEKNILQIRFLKKENEQNNLNVNKTLNRVKKLDDDYQVIYNQLEFYKNKLSEMTYIFHVTFLGIIENSSEIVFNKEGRNYVINIKYLASSYKYDILDIDDIYTQKDDDKIIIIKYKNNKNRADEKFRTNESKKIIKVFKDFQNKALEHLDVKKHQKEEKLKKRQIKKDVKGMFDIFGN
jgi:hypothetical protein